MFRGAVCRLYAPLHRVLQSCTSHGEASVVSCGHLPRMIAEISVASSFRFSIPYRRFFSKKRNASSDEDGNDIFLVSSKNPESPPKLFVVQPRLRPDSLLQAKLSEALNLANSLEEQRDGFYAEDFGEKKVPPHIIVQNPLIRSSRAHADTYFGPGTVENVKVHVRVSEEKDEIDAIFVNSMLSGAQQRNLELAWEKPVLDRVGLIIEIFNAHAQTKEAKLQSELAALMYKKTRLVRIRGPGGRLTFGALGEAQVVSARGRASGGRGFISGAGESELHLQRRRIQERRVHLLEQIEEVRRTRALQRASRKRHGGSDGGGLATVAVVGYTNAGKSTLVSALSQSDVYSDDRLFATVDPRLRHVILPSGKKVILSDTVGFISDLPVQLVEAFHATLEEVVEADLLVHVLDSSAKDLEEQKSTVLQVLHRIGVSPEKIQNMIEVWNKIDLLEGEGDGGGLLLEESEFSEDEFELDEGDEVNANDDMEEVNVFSDENEEVSSSGRSTEEEPTDDSSAESQRFTFEECILSNEDSQPVKTAALLGVGLQELLLLIDEKLDSQNTFQERDRDSSGLFYRKWRPPRFPT